MRINAQNKPQKNTKQKEIESFWGEVSRVEAV
jgi:hypothetical protein